MKIAFILPMFPVLSETFVLNQITGLVDQGHDVRIFAFSKDHNRKRHEDVVKYDLESRLAIVDARAEPMESGFEIPLHSMQEPSPASESGFESVREPRKRYHRDLADGMLFRTVF